jgi:hypothetical protein
VTLVPMRENSQWLLLMKNSFQWLVLMAVKFPMALALGIEVPLRGSSSWERISLYSSCFRARSSLWLLLL